MNRFVPALLIGIACLPLAGCYSNHFEQNPTPNNLAADAVNNTAVTVAMVPLYALALPVMAVSGLTEAIATPPACQPCDPCNPCTPCGTCPVCGDDACDCGAVHGLDGDEETPPAGASSGRGPGY